MARPHHDFAAREQKLLAISQRKCVAGEIAEAKAPIVAQHAWSAEQERQIDAHFILQKFGRSPQPGPGVAFAALGWVSHDAAYAADQDLIAVAQANSGQDADMRHKLLIRILYQDMPLRMRPALLHCRFLRSRFRRIYRRVQVR